MLVFNRMTTILMLTSFPAHPCFGVGARTNGTPSCAAVKWAPRLDAPSLQWYSLCNTWARRLDGCGHDVEEVIVDGMCYVEYAVNYILGHRALRMNVLC